MWLSEKVPYLETAWTIKPFSTVRTVIFGGRAAHILVRQLMNIGMRDIYESRGCRIVETGHWRLFIIFARVLRA